MQTLFSRALAVWLVLIVAESIHGTLRELLLKPYAGSVTQWLQDERDRIRHVVAEAETKLRAAGLTVTTVAEVGDPKQLLIAQAEQWEADCIFVGAKKHGRVDRFLLGSVSATVAARAHCSVEVVRV